MALVSPGVQVSVVDESFYTPAEPGTLPMIFVASASNKANGAGTGTAPGTTAATAGTANRGGGGGSVGDSYNVGHNTAGGGGKGIVIVSY